MRPQLKLTVDDLVVSFIGDPHLGKNFPHIPLHRKGEREAQQYQTFKEQLESPSDAVVMVGDLFDTYIVSNEVLINTYNCIREAAEKYKSKHFYMMNGNHDVSRNSTVPSTFSVLEIMCSGLPNVWFISNQIRNFNLVNHTVNKQVQFLLCPYLMFEQADEAVKPFLNDEYDIVVGHWDTEAIAGLHNLLPYQSFIGKTKHVVTGHVHTGLSVEMHGYEFHRTGSMLPYAHSEDPDGELYVTKTVEQVERELLIDPNCYKNKCLRIILTESDVVPEGFEALQVTYKKLDVAVIDEEELEVTMQPFNFKNIFDECFKENEVPDDVRDKYYEIYRENETHDN